MMGAMSWGHWAIVVLVVVLLFGRGMVSGLMADLGKAVKEARKIGDETRREG
jgi:sec-independent protein translocase protein TatA